MIKNLLQIFKKKELIDIKTEEELKDLKSQKKKNKKRKSKEIEKFLVIGYNLDIKNITSYDWDEIPKDFNLADFNKVIINLHSLDFDENKRTYFKLEEYNISNLVWNANAEIIVIGIPRDLKIGETYYIYNYHWLKRFPKYTYSKGDTFKEIISEFKWYFSLMNRWFFHFEYFSEGDSDYKIKVVEYLAKNIYGKPLAIRLKYELKERPDLSQSANIIWLPPPTLVDDSTAIIEILKNRYNICISTIEPKWVMKYKLPSEKDIKNSIMEIDQKIKDLNTEKGKYNRDLKKIKYKKKLLYEKGDELHKVVLESLKDL